MECFCGRKEGWGEIPPALKILRLRSGQVLGEINSNFIRTHAVMYYCYFMAERPGFEPGVGILSLQRFFKPSLSAAQPPPRLFRLLSRNVLLKQKNHGRHYYFCA